MKRFWMLTFLAAALLPCSCSSAEQSTRAAGAGGAPPELRLPNTPDSVKFAVIGDSGTGDRAQYGTAQLLARYHAVFPFEFVIMLGDNLYGSERPRDYEKKFERPYAPLLEAGVEFYASLGNHDEPEQRYYKPFHMDGRRYYTFRPASGIRFFALDSNYMDPEQLDWLEKELKASGSEWKICFFHHPIYSSGKKHGANLELRAVLEPLFVKYGVDVVFAGHEHFYERLQPQQGIHYFTSGASAKLRRSGIRKTPLTAKGYDENYSFMLVEIAGDALHFQTITLAGETVDSGTVARRRDRNITRLRAK